VKQSHPVTEADILKDIIGPDRSELNPEAAKSILALGFSRTSKSRIRSLLRANNGGSISPEERMELEKFLRVGQLVDLLQAKARASIETRNAA
jgi:hypothetical protein